MKAWQVVSFAAAGGMVKTLDQQTQIPAAFAGQVEKIDRDFLGKSIFISHTIYTRRRPSTFCLRLEHTVPRDGLQTGRPGCRR